MKFYLNYDDLERDTYIIFNAVMSQIHQFFQVYERTTPITTRMTEEEKRREENIINNSPIIKKCRYIQMVLLKKENTPLCNYLDFLKIEPQLYALRWVRLLFTREFHFDDAMILWDAIFCHGSCLKLLDYICVSMLNYIANDSKKILFFFFIF